MKDIIWIMKSWQKIAVSLAIPAVLIASFVYVFGLPQKSDERIYFKPASVNVPTRVLKLFYQNTSMNPLEDVCSPETIFPVERKIPITQTPIKDVITALIQGSLTQSEIIQGFDTEFPNKDFKLKGANLKNGVLTLEFSEVPGFTDGGSCRMQIMTSQIIKTARQFINVEEVRFIPETLFQP